MLEAEELLLASEELTDESDDATLDELKLLASEDDPEELTDEEDDSTTEDETLELEDDDCVAATYPSGSSRSGGESCVL